MWITLAQPKQTSPPNSGTEHKPPNPLNRNDRANCLLRQTLPFNLQASGSWCDDRIRRQEQICGDKGNSRSTVPQRSVGRQRHWRNTKAHNKTTQEGSTLQWVHRLSWLKTRSLSLWHISEYCLSTRLSKSRRGGLWVLEVSRRTLLQLWERVKESHQRKGTLSRGTWSWSDSPPS